jgi:hypothetical protein
VDRSCGGFQAG